MIAFVEFAMVFKMLLKLFTTSNYRLIESPRLTVGSRVKSSHECLMTALTRGDNGNKNFIAPACAE